jgi:hypothetical protein
MRMSGHCTSLTAEGQPCRNYRVNADGLCWRHDGRPVRNPAPRAAPEPESSRTCRICGHERPIRSFNRGTTNPKTGAAYYKRTCVDCEEAKRRAQGTPRRHERYNARGDVWCNNCKRYRPREEFKRHPLRPHTFWAYCKDCTRVLDRLRYRAKARTSEGKAAQAARIERRRRSRESQQKSRAHFVQDAILLLRRRGLTKSEICRLAGVSFGNLLKWERREVRVSPNVASRMGVLLLETTGWPLVETPAYRRQSPHPRLDELVARCAEQVAQYPVRTRWANRGHLQESVR